MSFATRFATATMVGTFAQRPAASGIPSGFFYLAYDIPQLYGLKIDPVTGVHSWILVQSSPVNTSQTFPFADFITANGSTSNWILGDPGGLLIAGVPSPLSVHLQYPVTGPWTLADFYCSISLNGFDQNINVDLHVDGVKVLTLVQYNAGVTGIKSALNQPIGPLVAGTDTIDININSTSNVTNGKTMVVSAFLILH